MKNSNSLCSVFAGKQQDYAPLSKCAVDRILEFDRATGFGVGGERPNRNRLYLYLTQRKSDVQIRTVAVKSPKRGQKPEVKEVVLSSVDDPWIRLRDVALVGMGGYVVDWTPQGFGQERYWSYAGRWESEAYAPRCSWKIHAPVVNPELLKRTRRFRWSDWESSQAHILDYLKVFNDHPEIEYLSKAGLGRLCTKVSVVRKLKADRKFRQFFSRHADAIRSDRLEVPAIMKAYSKGISFADARREISARREWRGYNLPRSICAVKADGYIGRSITRSAYATYLHNCQMMGLELSDTKVSFPKQFNRRYRIVQEHVDALRIKQNAEKYAKMNRQLAVIAEEWSWLERKRGAYQLVIPRSEREFTAEGKALANCLNERYASSVSQGVILVVFVRERSRPDDAFVAVEYSYSKGIVTQCYGAKNSKPPKKVRDFVKRIFDGVGAARLTEAA